MSLANKKESNIKLVSILFLISLTYQVFASNQDTRPYELNDANKRLNDIYKKIIGKLRPTDRAKLKKAQREWIIFRDLDCEWAFSAEPLDCLIDRTEHRVVELDRTEFFNTKNDYLSIETDSGL
jgi:hypothetical protein